MTIYKWLKNTDLGGLWCIVSAVDDEEPLFEGSIMDIPIYLIDTPFASKEQLLEHDIIDCEPVTFVWTERDHHPAIQFILA